MIYRERSVTLPTVEQPLRKYVLSTMSVAAERTRTKIYVQSLIELFGASPRRRHQGEA